MKRFKKVITGIFSIALSTVVLFSGCSNIPDSDDLFDPEVLDYYNLSWLEKPQGAQNEQSKNNGDDKDTIHFYTCTVESREVFEEYAAGVFHALKDGDYSVARLLNKNSSGVLWTRVSWDEVLVSDNLEDYKKGYTTETYAEHHYQFYFSIEEPGEYYKEYHGQILPKACSITIRYYDQYEQSPSFEHNFQMYVSYASNTVYVITDEIYLGRLL